MWDRLSQRERIMVIVLFVAIITGGYYLYIYQPTINTLADMQQEKSNKETQLITSLKLIQKLPDLQARYQELKYIEDIVYDNKDSQEFIQLISDISTGSGIEITFYSPKETQDTVSISFMVKGNYISINNFLSGLAELKNQLKFSRLLLQAVEEELQLRAEVIYNTTSSGGGKV